MLRVVFDYTRNLLTPFWLNIRYVDYPSTTLLEPKIILTILGLMLLVWFVLHKVRNGDKLPLFCGSWCLVTWLPVANIIPISTKMADRYMYLPAIGFFFAFSLAIFGRIQFLKSSFLTRILIPVIAATILLFYSWLGYERTKVWENSVTLWEDSLKKDNDNYIAHYSLGSALILKKEYKRAIYHTTQALKLRPGYENIHHNLGLAYSRIGKTDQAIYHLKKALEIHPKFLEIYNKLAVILVQAKKYKEAEHYFTQSLKLDPNNKQTRAHLKYVKSIIQKSGSGVEDNF